MLVLKWAIYYMLSIVVGVSGLFVLQPIVMGHFEPLQIDLGLLEQAMETEQYQNVSSECMVVLGGYREGNDYGGYNYYSDSSDSLDGEGIGLAWHCTNGKTIIFFVYEGANGAIDYVDSSEIVGR